MDQTSERSLVRTILEHAADHPWRLQEIGLLALRLDDRRERRLHVWDPEAVTGEPPIHDHPYDFTSTVVVGELVNTRYVEDPSGDEYRRERYAMGDEAARRSDNIRLVGRATTYDEGDRYRQLAGELHDSRQMPGTVTIITCLWREAPELTVCLRPGTPWVSGRSRPATTAEVARITTAALDRMGAARSPV